ncbi:IAA-alanine resistance protein 1 isoform X2 [Cucumis melo var. makuwa]|uniref:IAA-alanine resistance protein 1 isoform X2 n=1 Tax=Cucumis melo var. makuwa TaxID=1194695 RepID=A0A5D3CS11_CUCMM|nr:IAA-alanine resistance protein 1 isoform X2 [Cucumis melo var. makuwa]
MPNSCFFPFIFASALVFSLFLDLSFAHGSLGHHQCSHSHGHHQHAHHHRHDDDLSVTSKLLPEELAEEEDMRLYGFGRPYVEHDHESVGSSDLSGLVRGKPSKAVVDSLALFGAGAMLGDAFLHQLPHAFENGDDKTIVIIDENQSMENPTMKPMTANDALTVVVTGSPVGATAFIQVVVGFPFVAVASHTFFILIGSPANIFNPTTDNYLKVESGESSAHHKGKSTCDGQSGISPAMVKQLVALGAALGLIKGVKLNGQNYFLWFQSIKITLEGRHKFGYLIEEYGTSNWETFVHYARTFGYSLEVILKGAE